MMKELVAGEFAKQGANAKLSELVKPWKLNTLQLLELLLTNAIDFFVIKLVSHMKIYHCENWLVE